MTEKTDDKTAVAASSTTEASASHHFLEMRQAKRYLLRYMLAAILITLLLGLGLAYLFFDRYQQQAATTLTQLTERVAVTESKQQQQQNRLIQTQQENKDSVVTQLQPLMDAQTALRDQVAEMAANQSMSQRTVRRVWVLAEVKYLLQVMHQRIALAKDVDGALSVLALADIKLKQLADPRLQPLRALVAKERLLLAAVTQPDIEGASAVLNGLLEQVPQLSVRLAPEVTASSQPVEEMPAETSDWTELAGSTAASVWQAIRSLVVIRHRQQGDVAILMPKERYFMTQNLRLTLNQAHLALLAGHQQTYQQRLATAIHWLQTYFEGHERDVVIAALQQLQEQVIEIDIPDVTASLVWLQAQGDQ